MFYSNNAGMSPADYAAVSRGNNGGVFGGDGEGWIFILFLFAMMFNGNGWGGNNGVEIQSGFDQASIMNGLQGIQQTLMAYQISNNDNMNNLAMSFQQCCCQNQLATANLGAQIASEACANRQAVNDGLRDLMAQNVANTQLLTTTLTQGFQGLHDEFCQSRIDAKNDKIADLQRQVEEANDNARYNGLIAAFNQSQEAQTTAIEQYLNPTARPAYIVPNPNGCGCNQYCG